MSPDWLWLLPLLVFAGVLGTMLGHLLRRK